MIMTKIEFVIFNVIQYCFIRSVIDVSAKSGENIFVALNKSDDIEKAQGTEWKQYYEIAQSDIQKNFTGVETGIFYVYVGTKGDGLAEVEGKPSSI